MRRVRAVLVGWGGALTPRRPIDHLGQWHAFATEIGGTTDQVAELAERILEAESTAWHHARTAHRSARLEDLLTELGLGATHPAHHRARGAYERFWEPYTLTHAHVRPLWEWLRRQGIRVGVLSNTIWSRDYHRALFDRDGVLHLIDGDVYSSEIPWTKPHPESFRAAAAAVDTDPADCVYVGDRIFEDVHGPQQAGMRAILVPHSDIPHAQRVEVEARPDAVAHSLAEVAGIVRGWNSGDAGG